MAVAVSQRVQELVRGGDFACLTDHHQTATGQHVLVLLEIEVDAKSGNRLELIERTAGMAQPPARDHRHRNAGRRGNGGQDQRRFVANTAGAMLVDFSPGNVRKVDDSSRANHRIGERGGFLALIPRQRIAIKSAAHW